jgi:hypothetical protein
MPGSLLGGVPPTLLPLLIASADTDVVAPPCACEGPGPHAHVFEPVLYSSMYTAAVYLPTYNTNISYITVLYDVSGHLSTCGRLRASQKRARTRCPALLSPSMSYYTLV